MNEKMVARVGQLVVAAAVVYMFVGPAVQAQVPPRETQTVVAEQVEIFACEGFGSTTIANCAREVQHRINAWSNQHRYAMVVERHVDLTAAGGSGAYSAYVVTIFWR